MSYEREKMLHYYHSSRSEKVNIEQVRHDNADLTTALSHVKFLTTGKIVNDKPTWECKPRTHCGHDFHVEVQVIRHKYRHTLRVTLILRNTRTNFEVIYRVYLYKGEWEISND